MPTSADTSKRRHQVLRTQRRWSETEKRSIVAETREAGANISAISRSHGVAQSLVYQWRKLYPPEDVAPTFLPVSVAAIGTPMSAAVPSSSTAMIEIELARGRKVRVALDVDTKALARIVAALEAI
jgi:transposase